MTNPKTFKRFRPDLIINIGQISSIWELKPASNESGYGYTKAKNQLERYKSNLTHTIKKMDKLENNTVSIGSSGGAKPPVLPPDGLIEVTQGNKTYSVSFYIPEGKSHEGLIYYRLHEKTKQDEPVPDPVRSPIGAPKRSPNNMPLVGGVIIGLGILITPVAAPAGLSLMGMGIGIMAPDPKPNPEAQLRTVREL